MWQALIVVTDLYKSIIYIRIERLYFRGRGTQKYPLKRPNV